MKRIKDIQEEFKKISPEMLENHIKAYSQDDRKGVQKLLDAQRKRLQAYEAEQKRTDALWYFERQHASCEYICGIDEVGRGPLAGPVVAGAVILPKDCGILYINDSKQLSAKKREELNKVILEQAVAVGIGIVSHEVIDEINILNATFQAMRQAVGKLPVQPDLLMVDAVTIPELSIPQVSLIKGDARSISIGAASIVAKVYRDRLMTEYDKIYPGYDFASNKGYGSAQHIKALQLKGPCPIHRMSFIKNILKA